MADYGVVPEGFVRKPLAVILNEIETSNMTEFGPGVIQTPQSPLGQLNGLFANYVAQLWELAEDIYQSYDPDQAEGTRLDTLGRLRILTRGGDEQDEAFRSAITNTGRARVDLQDLSRAVRGLPGVTYAYVFVNDTPNIDENGMAPNTVAVAVIGGADEQVASEIRRYIVPGISTYGNVMISTIDDGYCRALNIIRPIPVPVRLNIQVRTRPDNYGCPPPSVSTLEAWLANTLNSTLLNGDDITWFRLRSIIEGQFPNVEVTGFVGMRDEETDNEFNRAVDIHFIEIATVNVDDVHVDVVP